MRGKLGINTNRLETLRFASSLFVSRVQIPSRLRLIIMINQILTFVNTLKLLLLYKWTGRDSNPQHFESKSNVLPLNYRPTLNYTTNSKRADFRGSE